MDEASDDSSDHEIEDSRTETVKSDEETSSEDPEVAKLPKLASASGKQYNILECAEKGKVKLIERFLQVDPSLVNVTDSEQYTPLHRACSNNRIEAVKVLISNGANIEAATVDGWQPIHSAAQWGNVQLVRLLLASGSDLNSRTDGGNTPFHLAATRAATNRELIEYLLFHDLVDIDATNNAGDTPFDICKRNSRYYKLWNLL